MVMQPKPSHRALHWFCKCSAVTNLEFLIIFEQGVQHSHYALGPTNYVVGSGLGI